MQDSNPETWERDETPTSFFNPLEKEQIIEYMNEDNVRIGYIIPPIKISTYPKYLTEHFVKHIVDEMINTRNLGYLTPEQRDELIKEITI